VFLGLEGERVDVDTSVWGSGVVLEWLDEVEVGSLTLREAVLAVKLELSDDDWVLTPAVEVKSSLREDEGSGIRNTNGSVGLGIKVEVWLRVGTSGTSGTPSRLRLCVRGGTSLLEDTVNSDESLRASTRGAVGNTTRDGVISSVSVNGIGESIDGVSVVEWLGTEELEERSSALERGAVVNVGIRLNNPDEFLAWVVEVELDFVRGRTNRLITSELELLNEILVWVLGHAAALVGVKEDVVDVERGSNERLSVGSSHLLAINRGVAVER